MAISINKNWLLLAAAIALGGAAFYLSNQAITSRITQIEEEASRGKTLVPVVVANRPMQSGEIIEPSAVSVRQIPAEYANQNMVTPDNFDNVVGQALLVDMGRGDALQISYTAGRGGEVFAATLQHGRRALTIEVDEISSISGMLRPGDTVDLMLTAQAGSAISGGERKDVTFPLLSNVQVLATGQVQKGAAASGESSARAYAHVTLDLSPEEATRVITAKSGGRLTAVLRSPNDHRINPSRPLSIDDVVASYGGEGGSSRSVEFLIGGGGNGGSVSRTPVLDEVMRDPVQSAQAEELAKQMLQAQSTPVVTNAALSSSEARGSQ